MPAKSVFISHASEDDGFVRELRQSLEALGLETWTDSERLSGGDLLAPKIRENIERADYFFAVVSLNALNSEWVNREIDHARTVNKKIIPLTGPGIGSPILRRLFGEEPLGISIGDGHAGVSKALPHILAAIGLQLPTEIVQHAQAQITPVADLVLELTDPAMKEVDGKRRANAVAKLSYLPPGSPSTMESQRYRFEAPLGPIEAEELQWYLERYINWPAGLFEDRAQRVVEALPKWGRFLYDCADVEAARKVLDAWANTETLERRFTVRVNKELIAGTPEKQQEEANEAATLLLALPWELLHDEKSYLFQGKRAVRVRRSLPNRDRQPALATEPPIRVLLVSPRPEDDSAAYIDHRVSARPLVEALSQLGDLAEFQLLEPPTFPALQAEIERAGKAGKPYHVVHFDGHGVWNPRHGLGQLCFEDPVDGEKLEKRRSKLIDADEIAAIVREHRIPLFFLEACQTAKTSTDPSASVAGRLLESGVASVAAMSHAVLVETARPFIAAFYKELLTGKRVGQAMLAGQHALKLDNFRGKTFTGELHLEDWFVPVLFQEEQDPQLIREVPAQQVQAVTRQKRELALGELPPEPPHQFLGRSRDLLAAERILVRERYLVVRGSGGEGKTTFAAELARWLVATRRFARVAFTSVEQITEARQVLFSIGHQLVPNFETQVGTDYERGCQFVERALAEHRTVVVIDNMESLLVTDEAGRKALQEILDLCARLNRAGQTRLIFTTREALPEPFARNERRIGRLDRESAIRLLGNALPKAPASGESEDDLQRLVDAVDGHARSLVLIAREVGAVGVRHATENLREVMRAIEAKHPGERENSLLASAGLSLARLPKDVRQSIRPLQVFHGGGSLGAIAMVLDVDASKVQAVADALIGVGLAESIEPGYLRFDPGLMGGDLTPEELAVATDAWAEAIATEVRFLYRHREKDPKLAHAVALLELPNSLAVLEHLLGKELPEVVVNLATTLEGLIAGLNRPRVLARVVEIRADAAGRLRGWNHAQYVAERAAIERLLDLGRMAEAVRAAQSLDSKCRGAGDDAYKDAAYDGALAQFTLGRALQKSGDAGAALRILEEARQRFERLNEPRIAGAALTEKADCLLNLGRYDDAAEAYQQAIQIDEQLKDPRSAAVDRGRLATVRSQQRDHAEALRLYTEVLHEFESLHELAPVAAAHHQIGRVYEGVGDYEAAEKAYQNSLSIKIGINDRSGQASTLVQLGSLYSRMGRNEDAVSLERQAIEIFVTMGNLWHEGSARNNHAIRLIALQRYDEARLEIERAVECKRPFGHVARPWTTFDILSDLERAVGNLPAAAAARRDALATYLAYRRDGGASEIDEAELAAEVKKDPASARASLDDMGIHYRIAAEIMIVLEKLEGPPAG